MHTDNLIIGYSISLLIYWSKIVLRRAYTLKKLFFLDAHNSETNPLNSKSGQYKVMEALEAVLNGYR